MSKLTMGRVYPASTGRGLQNLFDRLWTEDFWDPVLPTARLISCGLDETGGEFGATNTEASEEGWTLKMLLPGMDKDSLNITCGSEHGQDYLKVEVNRKVFLEDNEVKESMVALTREFGNRELSRAFFLPNLNPDSVSAVYQDGILTLSLKKNESAKPKQIEVKYT